MTYQELNLFYKNHFSLISIPFKAKVKLELINLICYIVVRTQRKISPYELLTEKIYKENDCMKEIPEIKALSCICEDLLFDASLDDFNNYEMNDAKSIMIRIKQILDETLPF